MAPGRSGARRCSRSGTTSRFGAARRRSSSRWRRRTGYDDGRQKAQLRGARRARALRRARDRIARTGIARRQPARDPRRHGRQRVGCRRRRPPCGRDVRGGDPGRPRERGREVQPRAAPAPDQGGRLARGRGRLVRRLRPVAAGRGRRRCRGRGTDARARSRSSRRTACSRACWRSFRSAVVALAFRRQRRVSRALGLEPVSGRRARPGRRAARRRVPPARDRGRPARRDDDDGALGPHVVARSSSSPMSRGR